MSTKPDLVKLAHMADRLNKQFGRHLDGPISLTTPYDWWKRTKLGDISEPLPKPVAFLGRSPVFRWSEVVRWFIAYRGIGKLNVSKVDDDSIDIEEDEPMD